MNQKSSQNHPKAKLILEDGSIFSGYSFGFPKSCSGEVVFSTGMVGYPQSMTDPSYAGQILVFTYPLIGNYGVPNNSKDNNGILENFESDKIWTTAIVVSEYSEYYDHWKAKKSLQDWMIENKVPGIFGIDTRALTIKIREHGVMLGKVVIDPDSDDSIELVDPNKENLVAKVSRKQVENYGLEKAKYKIVAVDCGMKNNILRCLLEKDISITVVSWDYDFNKLEFDGLFLANGPGDPTMCTKTIEHIKIAMKNKKPIFGICLGNQLLALAAGAKTYKLKYGHRSQNQPAVSNGRAYITSQNHGFAVDKKTLPSDWEESFYNANDFTNEGIKHKTLPFFSCQFHPEGSCGPRDTDFLFDNFIKMMERNRK